MTSDKTTSIVDKNNPLAHLKNMYKPSYLPNTYHGRPPQLYDPDQVEQSITEYIQTAKDNEEPLTLTGLAIALGFSSLEALKDAEERPDALLDRVNTDELTPEQRKDLNNDIDRLSIIGDMIKLARLHCENYAEQQLYGKTQVAGAIFNLKANYKWRETDDTPKLNELKGSRLMVYIPDELSKDTVTEAIEAQAVDD